MLGQQSLLLEFDRNPIDRLKDALLQLCGNNINWAATLLNSYYMSRTMLHKHFNIIFSWQFCEVDIVIIISHFIDDETRSIESNLLKRFWFQTGVL